MRNIVDLTLPLHNGIKKFPSPYQPDFQITPLGILPRDGRSTSQITIGSHTGTHVDAPAHFINGGHSIDLLDISVLVGPAKILNLGVLTPCSVINANQVSLILKQGNIERLVLCSSWSRFWGTPQYFHDWPVVSEDAVDLMIQKGVRLLGIDFPSPDIINANRNHLALMNGNVIIVEYLNNLDRIPATDIFLAALPLALKGVDAAPARVVAWWK